MAHKSPWTRAELASSNFDSPSAFHFFSHTRPLFILQTFHTVLHFSEVLQILCGMSSSVNKQVKLLREILGALVRWFLLLFLLPSINLKGLAQIPSPLWKLSLTLSLYCPGKPCRMNHSRFHVSMALRCFCVVSHHIMFHCFSLSTHPTQKPIKQEFLYPPPQYTQDLAQCLAHNT